MTTSTTFAASLIADDEAEALSRVDRHLAKLDGFTTSGRVMTRSAKHGLYAVEIVNEGGDVNDAWVVLTSYGISPAKTLGSVWQNVAGVGR